MKILGELHNGELHNDGGRMNNWAQYASHELDIHEVRAMGTADPRHWGWSNGMFIAGTDDMIAMRFAHGHKYEAVTMELWRRLCKDAEFVIDVGTHSGVYTLEAHRAGAKLVLSAEPHPINYSRLVMNLRKNEFDPSGAYYGAIGDKNGVNTLLIKGGIHRCYAAGRMELHNSNGEEIPVRVARLDSLVNPQLWPKLRAVKIDAENWTPNVIRGMGKMLEHKPDLIIEAINKDSGMEEILKEYGYSFWKISEMGSIEPCADLEPDNPGGNYNGTHEDRRNRLASVRGLP